MLKAYKGEKEVVPSMSKCSDDTKQLELYCLQRPSTDEAFQDQQYGKGTISTTQKAVELAKKQGRS